MLGLSSRSMMNGFATFLTVEKVQPKVGAKRRMVREMHGPNTCHYYLSRELSTDLNFQSDLPLGEARASII